MRITTCYNVTNNTKTGIGKFESEVEKRDQRASCAQPAGDSLQT